MRTTRTTRTRMKMRTKRKRMQMTTMWRRRIHWTRVRRRKKKRMNMRTRMRSQAGFRVPPPGQSQVKRSSSLAHQDPRQASRDRCWCLDQWTCVFAQHHPLRSVHVWFHLCSSSLLFSPKPTLAVVPVVCCFVSLLLLLRLFLLLLSLIHFSFPTVCFPHHRMVHAR